MSARLRVDSRGRCPRPARLTSRDLDFNAARLRIFGFGDAQLEHAVVELGDHLLGI